jgi:uncharacterized protein YyaL (SSP411 family)
LSLSGGSDHPVEKELLDAAYVGTVRGYDSVHGGFGGAPKFPPAMTLEFLLRTHLRTGNKEALEIVGHTCRKMAEGGMYDQIGGGFHRYSTDAKWLVPHFEKMLYDNALLSRLYLHYFQVSGDADARQTVEGILDYVLREMTSPAGGFYSTQDADSEGHEGKFFVWKLEEIESILGKDDAKLFNGYYDITSGGNFEGSNIPNITGSLADVARAHNVSVDALTSSLARSRQKLFEHREKRIKPDRDEKIITAWNGLMLASFSEAAVVLDRADYAEAARKNAEFVLANLRRDGFLLRTHKDGVSKFNAYHEDYAYLIEGLLTLYETTGELRWLNESLSLTEKMIDEFWDTENGAFFFTGKNHENLIVRSKDYFDNATPSGNSVATNALLRLAVITDNQTYRDLAMATLGEVADQARRYPSGFGYALSAMDFLLSTPKEVAIVGSDEASLRSFIHEAWRKYIPNKVVAAVLRGDAALPALLQNRPLLNETTTAFVCENYTCQQPVTTPGDLVRQLTAGRP